MKYFYEYYLEREKLEVKYQWKINITSFDSRNSNKMNMQILQIVEFYQLEEKIFERALI